jgi:hypothetical protein
VGGVTWRARPARAVDRLIDAGVVAEAVQQFLVERADLLGIDPAARAGLQPGRRPALTGERAAASAGSRSATRS